MALVIIRPRGGPAISPSRHLSRIAALLPADKSRYTVKALSFVHRASCAETSLNVLAAALPHIQRRPVAAF